MRRNLWITLLAGTLICSLTLAGCSGGAGASETAADAVQTEQEGGAAGNGTEGLESAGETAAENDQAAADEAAALIDAIYVQERTEDTDAQCAQAKAAWDALTDEQKELVEGENADPDYFGRDTGDASADDPGNQDAIGENEILVVSFGTSFNDSRVSDIRGIEDAIREANPGWSVRRAFTAQIIINHVQARDGEFIDNMEQAMERAASNGVKNLVIQPTHLMHGAEYDELMETVEAYRDKFETVSVAEPLLGEAGADASVTNGDKEAVARALTEAAVKDAGYDSLDAAKEDGAAFVFLGHGTSHTAKVSYSQMQSQMGELGYDNAFIGTVEGEPEETACEAVIEAVAEAGYQKVILRPLMVVAGDHANNDMAGDDEDSWLSMFRASGRFESVETQITGLGSIEAIREIYVEHTAEAMEKGIGQAAAALPDGTYTAEFMTDSSMFRVNEACGGKGTLTVKNGKMAIHISLGSKKIVNLYPGLAEDAMKAGAELLAPTEDTVTYGDGMTEEVYGFDVPVPALDTEFDLALIGTKGKWYDHKVSVSGPVPEEGGVQDQREGVLEDGSYSIEITFAGGSGKAEIISPAVISVADGKATAAVQWSSPSYDYMIVGGEKYFPVNADGDSVFEIPVLRFDEPMEIIGDTVAMSRPHEIEYTITFHLGTVKKK
ncbi:MAG: sirohydrochlorin cobaltochelatase [Blautia sp.]|nr:sirohydrochlorin cobaltochelatase [Blautia sp.]MCM1202128.1 sirohydrochlorin cobaltochelatase [Bacteroides fragilis]